MSHNHRSDPTITLLNLSSNKDLDIDSLAEKLAGFLEEHFTPVWHRHGCLRAAGAGEKDIPAGHWGLVICDNFAAGQAAGFRHLTPEGLPLGTVYLEQLAAIGEELTVGLSHDITEMLVNPTGQEGVFLEKKNLWISKEVADPVYGTTVEVDGVPFANFVHPEWFEENAPAVPCCFDHREECKKPLQVLKGAYVPTWSADRGWQPLFGSKSVDKVFPKHENRRGWLRSQGIPRTQKSKVKKPRPTNKESAPAPE